MTTRSYEQTIDVETPELVVLTYSVAGVGSRVLAGLTDLAICVAALVAILVALLALDAGRVGAAITARGGAWATAILILAQFALFWGYYVLFEGLMDGQTPGKRLHRLRVVQEGGYSVTLGVSAARNLVRILDMQPGIFYFVGLASLILTRRGRRLGDLVAGTIVVREEIRAAPPRASATRLSPSAPALQTALSEDEYTVLARFVERWSSLEPERRSVLARSLAGRFGAALPDDGRPPGQRLLELHDREARARAAGVASRGEAGAGRERQALVKGGVTRWHAFATRLAIAQKGGLRRFSEPEVRDFVAEYRAIAADLARLRTAAAGRDMDEMLYVGRLVAGAHNLLYRSRRLPLRGAAHFLLHDVPREIRRSAVAIGIAAALLFGPAAIAATALVRRPALASELLPEAMIRRASDGVRRARSGEGYIDDPQLFRPVMASGIVANNIQVSFVAFAGGVTAGLLTVLVLVGNGISLGSVVGLYVSKGVGGLLLAFVAPHGVLELFAICVAGGAGLLLAAGLLLPGERTRRRALVENARRAVQLLAATTMLLVVAGLLEGFVSPIEWWPLEGKLGVSGVTLVALVVYLRGGRAARPGSVDPPAPPDDALALASIRAPRAT